MPKVPTRKLPPMLQPYEEEKPKKIKYPPNKKTSKNSHDDNSNESAESEYVEVRPSKKSKKQLPSPDTKRPVIYAEVEMRLYDKQHPLTRDEAEEILGWQVETENVKFTNDLGGFLLKDMGGRKVRCTNNVTNRPLRLGAISVLKQEVLRKRWRLNGETLIIGKTGLVLNGQHTLIAFILACQTWEAKLGQYQHVWKNEPVIEKAAIFGIEETDDVVNTLDTGTPRSLADAIFRSELFIKYPVRHRKQLSKAAEHATKMLWHRTGAGDNAFNPKRTHAEALNFIERHPRILDCVKHIYEENGKKNSIGEYLKVGYAASLCYLAACSKTDAEGDNKDGYIYVDDPDETLLDWQHWDKAQEFFVLLAANDKALLPVRAAVALAKDVGGGLIAERYAILVKAWKSWLKHKKVTGDQLELEYVDNEDGVPILAELPLVGGIDQGAPTKPE